MSKNALTPEESEALLVRAPWTQEQVESLNGYQACGLFHPYTGGDGLALVATPEGWRSPSSAVVQDWALRWTADGSWRAAAAFWDRAEKTAKVAQQEKAKQQEKEEP